MGWMVDTGYVKIKGTALPQQAHSGVRKTDKKTEFQCRVMMLLIEVST